MKSKYTYTGTGINEITALYQDGYYTWIAFKGSGNLCKLKKVSSFNPDDVYYSLDIALTEITAIWGDSNYLYCSANDSVNLGLVISKTAPLTDCAYLPNPAGITEKAVDVIFDASYIYLLTPGEASGENAKICLFDFNSPYTFIQTIDLSQSSVVITNAKSIDEDGSSNLWVMTKNNPPEIVKIWDTGGLVFAFYDTVLS